MRKKEPGIDLIRCIGLLFVVSIHFFYNNNFYFQPQNSWRMLPANSARWLVYCCNGIFMTLTGYLKTVQPLSKRYYRSLLPVLVSYGLASMISIPIRHLFLGDPQSFATWFYRLCTFFGVNYGWYVKMYVGLLLFSPILNLAMDQLNGRSGLLWLAGTMLILTALPSATDLGIAPDYWVSLYPLTYYVLGAVIRRLQPAPSPVLCLGGAVLTAVGLGICSLLTSQGNFTDGFGQGYGGFWITLITLLLFLGLYRAQPGPRTRKLLDWASGGVFEAYMLSHLLDAWVYKSVPQWQVPGKWFLGYLFLTLPIFLVSLVAGKALHAVTAWILSPFQKSLQPAVERHSGKTQRVP